MYKLYDLSKIIFLRNLDEYCGIPLPIAGAGSLPSKPAQSLVDIVSMKLLDPALAWQLWLDGSGSGSGSGSGFFNLNS